MLMVNREVVISFDDIEKVDVVVGTKLKVRVAQDEAFSFIKVLLYNGITNFTVSEHNPGDIFMSTPPN